LLWLPVPAGGAGRPVQATPTPAATATGAALPIPDLGGEWSLTRTWYRRCPGCGVPVIRTTPWVITQVGAEVRVNRGPRGWLTPHPGGAYLALEGLETDGLGVLRFWYATLRVSADGSLFEGGFNGSETLQNPCRAEPPAVTCVVSAGTVRAQRVRPIGPGPTPPLPPTLSPTETTTATATAAARASASPPPSLTPVASPSPWPPAPTAPPPAASASPPPSVPSARYLPLVDR
jgi:hypothetical protein